MTNRDMVKDGSKGRALPQPNLSPPTPVPAPEGDERLFTTQDPPRLAATEPDDQPAEAEAPARALMALAFPATRV